MSYLFEFVRQRMQSGSLSKRRLNSLLKGTGKALAMQMAHQAVQPTIPRCRRWVVTMWMKDQMTMTTTTE